jgi:hypothetical protein
MEHYSYLVSLLRDGIWCCAAGLGNSIPCCSRLTKAITVMHSYEQQEPGAFPPKENISYLDKVG